MAKRGRKSVYDTKIKPRFDDILKWLHNGATEEQIYKNLGISKDDLPKFKEDYQATKEETQSFLQRILDKISYFH